MLQVKKSVQEQFIKGKVTQTYNDEIRINYNIEQVFFEENAKFQKIEITIEISLITSVRANISQILQNEKLVEIEYKEINIKR